MASSKNCADHLPLTGYWAPKRGYFRRINKFIGGAIIVAIYKGGYWGGGSPCPFTHCGAEGSAGTKSNILQTLPFATMVVLSIRSSVRVKRMDFIIRSAFTSSPSSGVVGTSNFIMMSKYFPFAAPLLSAIIQSPRVSIWFERKGLSSPSLWNFHPFQWSFPICRALTFYGRWPLRFFNRHEFLSDLKRRDLALPLHEMFTPFQRNCC